MIYLVKIICPSCEMKIEVEHDHFNKALDCPNCGGIFTLPDPNELKDQVAKLKKEIETLKTTTKSSDSVLKPNRSLKQKQGTFKLGKEDLMKEDESSEDSSLKAENEALKKKLEETQTMNEVLKEELADTFKELEKAKLGLPQQGSFASKPTADSDKTLVPVFPDESIHTSETQKPIVDDGSINSAETKKVAANHCIKCAAEISLNAKFCIACGSAQV